MLIKSLISLLFSIGISGCSQDVRKVKDPVQELIALTPYSGKLPTKALTSEIADIQSKLSKLLAEGVSDDKFTSDLIAPTEALYSLGFPTPETWHLKDGRHIMFLVHKNLKRVNSLSQLEYFPNSCPSGTLYTGYSAARSNLEFSAATEAARAYKATPYGVLTCVQSEELSITLIPSDHEIFGLDAIPHTVAVLDY